MNNILIATLIYGLTFLASTNYCQLNSILNKDDEPITNYFASNSLYERYDQNLTFDDYILYSMRALNNVIGFDNDIHRYDQHQELIDSISKESITSDTLGNWLNVYLNSKEFLLFKNQTRSVKVANELNEAKCGQQLKALISESQKLYENFETFSCSRQLSLIDFFDSFGSIPNNQLMSGNFNWLGAHQQCENARPRISINGKQETLESRYCIANIRSPGWQKSGKSGNTSLKLGICLPISCNSISNLRHLNLIEALLKIVRLNQVPFKNYQLTHLFCLPDEDSPLRELSLSAKLFVYTMLVWLALVLYHTIRYEIFLVKQSTTSSRSEDMLILSDWTRIFAIRLCLGRLFEIGNQYNRAKSFDKKLDTTAQRSKLQAKSQLSDNESGIGCSDYEQSSLHSSYSQSKLSDKEDTNEDRLSKVFSSNINDRVVGFEGSVEKKKGYLSHIEVHSISEPFDTRDNPPANKAVNLTAIDGIKVLSMIWLIAAHTLLFLMRNISNGREFWSLLRDARFLTIMAGIFPVDTFFTVTGILTAYLKFNKHDGTGMSSTKYWIEVFVHRYLRFMPMYLIIFWYTRDVSQYIGSGPLWDYATADTSLRSICKRESFLVPLLFQANFKSIDQHCVKPAWYLANDYQYLLVTPVFMLLILKSAVLGYAAIILSIVLSLFAQFFTVYYSSEFNDFEALINFRPMFATYVLKDLWRLYVLPFNRIVPYLIGLLTGHLMYERNKSLGSNISDNINNPDEKETSLSRESRTASIAKKNPFISSLNNHLCIGTWVPLLPLISVIYSPLITKFFIMKGQQAEFGGSIIIAIMRFVWSISISRLVYVCVDYRRSSNDSFIRRFLTSPKWKPWSKIGLSVLLIQWEVISYFAQMQAVAPYMTISVLLEITLICIVVTYLLGIIIYVIVEYPLSQLEQLYISPLIFKKSN